MIAANCGIPAAEMTELLRKIRPKSSSSGKISSCIGRNTPAESTRYMSGSALSKRDALRADQLLGGLRKECAGFYGGVVGDDHARHAGDVPDAGDGSGGGNVPPLLIHFVGSPKSDFEKWRTLVEEKSDSFARRQSPQFALAFLAGFAAAFAQYRFLFQNRSAAIAERSAKKRCVET